MIGIFILCLNFCLYVEVFYCLMSDTIHWWYVIVAVVLLVPLFIASTFFVVFFSDENHATRGRLDVACYLSIISLVLLQVWNIWYFIAYYKSNAIYFGTPRVGYTFGTKKAFLFWNTFITAWIIFLLGYCICVCRRYHHCLRPKDEDEKKGDEESAKKEDEKKDDDADKKEGDDENKGE